MNYDNSLRTKEFKENEKLNDLISELSDLLKPLQREVEEELSAPQWPIGFIVGSPRSGTTLLTQWLASLGTFSYPSNLLTRFAYAPYIGALIQKMIFDREYDYNNDFYDIQSDINYTSNLGKSKGALAVNEFQHFFRNYLNHFEPKYLTEKEMDQVDFKGLKRGLASIEKAFDKPFITKAALFKYNLPELTKAIPGSVIFFIKRDASFTMQSLYMARQKYYGNTTTWYGSKPPEYEELKNVDVYHQIAGQVYFTDQKIENDLKQVDENKQISISYEDFCINPAAIYDKITKIYSHASVRMLEEYTGPDHFESTNRLKLEPEIVDRLNRAYENVSKMFN